VADEVKLPRLGQGMEMGTIVRWLKNEGDPVAVGEPLYELDTEKVTQEVEAEASGVLLRIAVPSGEVPVGETVAVIGQEGESVELAPAEPAPPPPSQVRDGAGHGDESVTDDRHVAGEPAPAQAPSEPRDGAGDGGESATDVPRSPASRGRIKASPLARRIARERGIDLGGLEGTGPDGRIVAEDVERAGRAPAAAAAPAVATGEPESVPLTNVRRTIARRLTTAWQVPAFELTVSADMTRANDLIARVRELDPDVRVTVTDLLAKLSAQALVRHPDVNVQFSDDALLRFPSVGIGIATAAPQGLVVPVVRAVERLSLAELWRLRAEVIGRAREGKLRPEDLDGGTFTISNLGMYGVETFVAVLNPPQAAILAVGAAENRAVVRDGELVVRPMLTVTLTVDHRAVDGAPAAEFLRTLKAFLEEPALAL
jgi:pyruvate dehydrogenase E2 component (dihydrolipoyllysine-residue acetyltransferase)